MTMSTLYPGAIQAGRVSVIGARPLSAVALEEAKLHLRVDTPDEDAYIQGLIDTAVSEIDAPTGWLGRSLFTRSMRLTLDEPPPPVIRLPGPPIRLVSEIRYRDYDDAMVTLPDTVYRADTAAEPGLVWPARGERWPQGMARAGPRVMEIDYDAGYGDAAEDIPRPIRQWVLLRVGELYRDREASIVGTVATQLAHAQRMLDNYRIRV